jgi:hypothetical protein
MADYEPIDLAGHWNASLRMFAGGRLPVVGDQVLHGLPFRIGTPDDEESPCFVVLEPGSRGATVPVRRRADRIVVAHRRLQPRGERDVPPSVGDVVAEYVFQAADGSETTVPIRERFEICAAAEQWWDIESPFLAAGAAASVRVNRFEGRWEEIGMRQADAVYRSLSLPDYFLWVWENPRPDDIVDAVELRSLTAPVLVAAMTVANAREHPFPLEAARTIKVTAVGPDGPRRLDDLRVEVDRGRAGYTYPLPRDEGNDAFRADPFKGWGEAEDPSSANAYARVSAVPSATVRVLDGDDEVGRFVWRDLTYEEPLEHPGIRVEVVEQGRTWVRATVLDDDTGGPVSCRVHFRSPSGVPYQPHGHHDHVNADLGTWHIDVGGDVRLGRLTYAYIDGTCQGWLPTGDVFVDVARGFEYEPLREKVTIAPGQRELTLRIKRWTSMNERGWYSGDSHVHFLSAQGALTEQQGEDLNVVNLLQSQWGSLFTNTEDWTGEPLATEDGRHVTWVSQENRQPFYGHLVLWGLHEPVMPWCTDGLPEAELGAWLETTVSDWADRCHEQGGTVVIPHFPLPNGEPAVLIATERADAIEFVVGRPRFHEEYYRYLNCGYRIPLVGGTDKMSGDVPVGIYRTYARLGDDEFSHQSWSRAVRQGRTFMSGGPIIEFRVDGHDIGDTVELSGPGTVEVTAHADSIFPIGSLQLVHNGRVIAATDDTEASRHLELRAHVRIDGDSWLAARCGGPRYFDAPSHREPWERAVMAHTSPIYVACNGNEWHMFDAGQARHMQTVVQGGLEHMRGWSRRYPEDRITHHHSDGDHQAFLERPFQQALRAIEDRLRMAGS